MANTPKRVGRKIQQLSERYGGGAFLIAYFTAVIIVVLPLMILEVAAGRLV
ncbi:hypothetical protein J3U76_12635 [Oceanisphaera sp. DM8]|uniref:Uncharacterized protein n=1 Tax=Oceanisphaera pacifica TaxID=2818389 RepID=A0ABS3NIQ0_9GAMM|nr:hypothetical protein [Oceanisphaera pacifica]